MPTVQQTNNISTNSLVGHNLSRSVEVFGSPIVEETEARKEISVTLAFEENGLKDKVAYKGTYILTQPNEGENSYRLELQLKRTGVADTKYPSDIDKTMTIRAQPDGFIRIPSIPLTKEAESEFDRYLDYFKHDTRLMTNGKEALELAIDPSLKHSLFQVYAFDTIKNKHSEDIKMIGAENYSELAWKLKSDHVIRSDDPATVEGALVKYVLNARGQAPQIASAPPPAPIPQPPPRPMQAASVTPPPRPQRPTNAITPSEKPKEPVTAPIARLQPEPQPTKPPRPASHPPQVVVITPATQASPPLQPAPRPLQVASTVPAPPPVQLKRQPTQPPSQTLQVEERRAEEKRQRVEEKKQEVKKETAKEKKPVKDKKLSAVADLIRSQPAQPTKPADGRIGSVADNDEIGYKPSGLGFKQQDPDGTSGFGTIQSMGVASGDEAIVPSMEGKKERFVAEMDRNDNVSDLAAADFAEDPEVVEARENGEFIEGVSAEDIQEEIKEQEREIRDALARLSNMKNKNIEELSALAYEAERLIDKWRYNKVCITQFDKKTEQKYNSLKAQIEKISKKRGL